MHQRIISDIFIEFGRLFIDLPWMTFKGHKFLGLNQIKVDLTRLDKTSEWIR